VIEGWDDELRARSAPRPTGERFCPTCGTERVTGARFCASCGRAFDVAAAPVAAVSTPAPTTAIAPPPPTTAPIGRDHTIEVVAGVAWLIAAGCGGYLALQQLQLVQYAQAFGVDAGGLQGTAVLNGVFAIITVFFGIKLFMQPSEGLLGWSIVWAVLDVIGGVLQAGQGIGNPAFLGSIVAARVAGICSFVAQRQVASEVSA
jgi:hypothetical protein